MARLLWDASALAKRYAPEVGSEVVNGLWFSVPPAQMATTFSIYAETYSIMLRKRNRGSMGEALFVAAKSLLRGDIINSLDFVVLASDTSDVLAGIDLMERHSINSSDATFLAVCLRYAAIVLEPCVVVAADSRLLRAAVAEGLNTLNPEQLDLAAALALLSKL